MTLDKTPVDILENEVRFLSDFIDILDKREDIDPSVPQEKLNLIKEKCENKIAEFKNAIDSLKLKTENHSGRKILNQH